MKCLEREVVQENVIHHSFKTKNASTPTLRLSFFSLFIPHPQWTLRHRPHRQVKYGSACNCTHIRPSRELNLILSSGLFFEHGSV